jgi:hypothetical protein
MRHRMVTIERVEAVARAALIGGYGSLELWSDRFGDKFAGTPRRCVRLHLASDCRVPYEYALHSRFQGVQHGTKRPMSVIVVARCRKCDPCKEARQMQWRIRAVIEYGLSPRTLFGTLTFTPHIDAVIDATARVELHARGVDFDALSEVERFRERVSFGGRYVTTWLKRLRIGRKGREKPLFRYLIVAEAHNGAKTTLEKRGRPHFHCLLHEMDMAAPLVALGEWSGRSDRYGNPTVADDSFLKTNWHGGHSAFSLCRSSQAAGYLCKYLTKADTNVRIRASFKYGRNPDGLSASSEGTLAGKLDNP